MGALVDKIMGAIGINTQTDEPYDGADVGYDGYEGYDQEDGETVERPTSRGSRRASYIDRSDDDGQSGKNSSNIISINSSMSSSKMVITQATCYEDVEEIGCYLKNKKSVIINLENVSKDDARRILDFLSGAAFMIEGTIQKVSNLIYLMTPRNVEIQNDLERNQFKQQKSSSFSWLK